MPRRKTQDTAYISVQFTVEERQALDAYVAANGYPSRNAFVRELIAKTVAG